MKKKTITILGIGAVLFTLGFAAIVFSQMRQRKAPETVTPQAEFKGNLSIHTIRDMRVAGRKITLCGVSYTKPPGIEKLISEAARSDYQGRAVTCRPVGTGTPCDGRVAAKFGGSVVAQCFTSDGTDLAQEFSKRGFLCDVPAQSGGRYVACGKP
ncbi:hypothetical protein [Mesorhizobium sp. M0898]|uniref:hypothetical protein n=1 Tax=Mesorhizobium sp. M0898 TaxID=2957020 RepID=UPI003337B3E4